MKTEREALIEKLRLDYTASLIFARVEQGSVPK